MIKSEIESNVYQLNFYRANADFFTQNTLEQQQEFLSNHKVDLVRFALPSTNFDLSNEFRAFKKYTFLNTILNYEKDTTQTEDFPLDLDYELKEATLDDKEIIAQLIKDVFEYATFGYFTIPFLKDKISSKMELQALQSYILDLLNQPNSGIQLFRNIKENEIVGFSSYIFNNNNQIYRPYTGIISNKRNIKVYEKLIYAMIQYNYNHKIDTITFGSRADNMALINKYNRLGSKVTSINYNFLALV